MSEMNTSSKKNPVFFGLFLAAVLAVLLTVTGKEFLKQHEKEPIVPGPGVTEIKMLSDYFPKLKGTGGDSEVYILDSKKPGGTFVVMGGTHPTEPAGVLSAVLFVENAVMQEGKLIVVPHSCESGFTWVEPGQGHSPYFHIKTDWGQRTFRYGGRGSNPIHQFPDPDMYLHYPSGQILAADEIRNLNRAHPGNPDGLLTQQIAYAFRKIVETENADLIIDQHEAPPEKPLVNAICVHQRALDLAAMVALDLETQDIEMRVEASPVGLHGFSHRELGDHTKVLAILSETPNPSQGSARGRTDETMAVTGYDPVDEEILAKKMLKLCYTKGGVPIEVRTGRDVATICQIATTYTEMTPDRPIVIGNMPSYEEITKNGLGKYLLPVPEKK